jgi:ABC-type transporter Mla subunit MlaD
MPLQDLTPQLRTRLSRVERAVGWFISVAVIALLAALGYYIYHRAEVKGWFLTKVNYRTSLNNAAGLKVGDPVKLMGFNVGEITRIEANAPDQYYGVTIDFRVKDPYYGYIWLDSKVRVAPSDFLGNRYLEVLKGTANYGGAAATPVTVILSNKVASSELFFPAVNERFKALKAKLTADSRDTNSANYAGWNNHMLASEATNLLEDEIAAQPQQFYTNINATNYWLEPLESPALTERLETLVSGLELALPNILNLTNELTRVLTNTGNAAAHLDAAVADARPMISNLNTITYNIRDPNGSLGTWILGKDLRDRLSTTMSNAQETLIAARSTLNNTDTNITTLAVELEKSLNNLANLTGNLNAQVQTNGGLVSDLDKMIAHTDGLVQGLKHHWLLRSAFKKENKEEEKKQKQNR